MTVKIRDPRRWKRLPMGDVIALGPNGRRTVRLEINVSAEAQLTAVYPDETNYLLGVIQPGGPQAVEFVADGPVEVWVTSEAEVFFYTDDGDRLAYVNDKAASFVSIHTRRSESEQIIHMQNLMLANQERNMARLEAAAQEAEALRARLQEVENAQSGEQAEPENPDGGGAGAGAVPEPEGETSEPAAAK